MPKIIKDKPMSAEEFIRLSELCHYANKKYASKYVKEHPKDCYTTDDFIAMSSQKTVYPGDHTKGLSYIPNGKTTAFLNGAKGNSSKQQDWK